MNQPAFPKRLGPGLERLRSVPSIPYIAPFLAFIASLGALRLLNVPDLPAQLVLIGIPTLVLLAVSRQALQSTDSKLSRAEWIGSLSLGGAVFAIWIGPDLLVPGYRQLWPFNNPLVATTQATLSEASRSDTLTLALRFVRAAVVVPVVEELFWRAWLMRWVIEPDFRSVPLGAYSARAFWAVAILFATEHGPYWDVGLVAGILYNWWMVRTRSVWALISAHAMTNACLSAYVIAAHRWEYWS